MPGGTICSCSIIIVSIVIRLWGVLMIRLIIRDSLLLKLFSVSFPRNSSGAIDKSVDDDEKKQL